VVVGNVDSACGVLGPLFILEGLQITHDFIQTDAALPTVRIPSIQHAKQILVLHRNANLLVDIGPSLLFLGQVELGCVRSRWR